MKSGITVPDFTNAPLVQLVERWIPNPDVGGSNPSRCANLLKMTSERKTDKHRKVIRSWSCDFREQNG